MTLPTTTLPDLTTGLWAIDPAHSEVSFTVRHLMSKVRGVFSDFSGEVLISEEPRRSRVDTQIAIASVDTRQQQRDAHLRSAEILDAERHSHMTFRTTGVRPAGDGPRGDHEVDGELTVSGATRPVTLAVEFLGVGVDPWGGTRAGFSASTHISRKDFGIEFNIPLEGDKLLLGDRIDINLEIQAVRQS